MRINFKDKAKRKCKVCGKSFTPQCPPQVYCSDRCRAKSQLQTNWQFYLKVKKDKKGNKK